MSHIDDGRELLEENAELREQLAEYKAGEASYREQLLAAESKLKALSEQEWQPIETAPKDGSRILVYRPLAEKTQDHAIDIKRGVPRNSGCWEETIPDGMNNENFTDGYCKPTHWMPLPAAPSASLNAQEGGE